MAVTVWQILSECMPPVHTPTSFHEETEYFPTSNHVAASDTLCLWWAGFPVSDQLVHTSCRLPSSSSLLFLPPPPVRIAIVQGPPSEVVVYEGQSARFDCVASGSPPPAVIWLFERSVISLIPDSGLQDLNNGSLFIPHLSPEHAGQYMCVLELPPVDYHAFTVIVVPLSSPRPSMRPTLLPRKVASTPFTIGEYHSASTGYLDGYNSPLQALLASQSP